MPDQKSQVLILNLRTIVSASFQKMLDVTLFYLNNSLI